MPKQFIFDGASIKSVSPWDLDSNVGWDLLSAPDDAYGVDVLAQRVPWMYRGIKDRANNVSSMPWAIVRGKTDIATGDNWGEDKPAELEFITNPRKLLAQVEESLTVAGKAYLSLECNRSGYVKALKYLNPATITECYDKVTGELTHYERKINGRTVKMTLASQPPENGLAQCLAIYDAGYLTEIGPGKSSPALAALTAAGVLLSYDEFVVSFFQRGAIKASVLTVESASPGEQERLQHWWDDVVSGVKNAWSAIVLRGKMNAPVVIGEGMESVGKSGDTLTESRRQDICTAMGIPESRMWSSAANYATRKEDELAYYRGTIIPECNVIAEALNEQLFTAIHHLDKMRLVFRPDTLDVFQEDEADRAASLGQLTGAGVPLKLAMEILGYDLTPEQWALIEEKDAEPEPAPVVVAPPAQAEDDTNSDTTPEDDVQEMPPDRAASVRAMLRNWERKAKHAHKLTQCADVPWTTELLPAGVVQEIHASLAACGTVEQVKAVFAGVEVEAVKECNAGENRDDSSLVFELKRANDLLASVMA